jgi:hypothetical protein
MAAWQIAESLSSGDKRCKGIQKDYDALPDNPFLGAWFDRYGGAFKLARRREFEGDDETFCEGASQAPSKPHRSQEQEQEQEQEPPKAPKGAGRPGFEAFWTAWPKSTRKGGKADCERVWRQKSLEAQSAAILAHVTALAKTDGWTKQGGEFVPAPVVYLRGKRWDGADLGAVMAANADDIFAGAH